MPVSQSVSTEFSSICVAGWLRGVLPSRTPSPDPDPHIHIYAYTPRYRHTAHRRHQRELCASYLRLVHEKHGVSIEEQIKTIRKRMEVSTRASKA